MSIPRTESGKEIAPSNVGIDKDFGGSANYIVPQFHDSGYKTRAGIPISNDASRRMEKILSKYGERMQPVEVVVAERPVAKVKVKKGKKSKPVNVELSADEVYVQTPPSLSPTLSTKPNIVVLSTPLGKIRTVTDAILETDIGIALVFKDEAEVRYVPEQGNELTLILPGNKELQVMYLGLLFSWYNTEQKVMIFIKSEI